MVPSSPRNPCFILCAVGVREGELVVIPIGQGGLVQA